MKKTLYLLVAVLLTVAPVGVIFGTNAPQPHKIERRAAFDIGSGQIKMQVSDVDITANKIVNVLLTDIATVKLRESLVKSLDGRLSSDIQNQTVEAIVQLLEKAAPFHPEARHAVATETLRLAKNGEALAERIKNEAGVPVTIISQEEEGILGFISAVSISGIDPVHAVSWDFGGASFQITMKCDDHYMVYQGKLGKIPFKIALLQIQGRTDQTVSPNPISKPQVTQALQFIKDTLKDVPATLRQKLHRPDTIVLEVGINPLYGMLQNTDFNSLRLQQEIESRVNLDDDAIMMKDSIAQEYKGVSAYVVSNLILALGIMQALDISQVHYAGTQGANAVGVLLSPKYWETY